MQEEEEELEGADLVKLINETVEELPEHCQWLVQAYQPKVYLAEMNQVEDVEAVILGLTRGATFPITISDTNCNAPLTELYK